MKKVQLFLDSGAFSAMTQGTTISLDEYIAFIHANKAHIALYAVLDVIGDAAGTLRNQRIMEEAGLSPLPCFHFGEPWKYLRMYVDEYDYIAIGGTAKRGPSAGMYTFLDDAFSIICGPDGLPQTRVHGFGISMAKAMIRYPWYSVDTAGWLMYSRMGDILLPYRDKNGDWDFLESTPERAARKIAVSNVSPDSTIPNAHISTLSEQWRDDVLAWLDFCGCKLGRSHFRTVPIGYKLHDGEKWAKSPNADMHARGFFGVRALPGTIIEVIEEPGVSNDYTQRDIAICHYYKGIEDSLPAWPWAWDRPKLRGFNFK